MKKVITIFLVVASVFSFASAYNPPVGAEKMFDYSSPNALSGNMTVTGGALFNSGADSLIVNPALAAGEQRVSLNLGYTFLHSYGGENTEFGGAFQTAILIHYKLFVFSGYLNGTFMPFSEMNIGNSFNIKASLSKEITDKLDIGLGINGGIAWSDKATWALSANLGFNYNYGDLWIFKDFRYGASMLNLGKNYILVNNPGVDIYNKSTHFPSILTIKIGAAGTVFDNDFLDIGVAMDLTTTLFLNLIADFNAQIVFKDFVFLSIGESINVTESAYNRWSAIPSVSVGVKFSLDVKNNQYFDKNGWSKNEMSVSTGYKNLYGSVNAYSAGVDLDLGMKDTTPPVIKFLDEEE